MTKERTIPDNTPKTLDLAMPALPPDFLDTGANKPSFCLKQYELGFCRLQLKECTDCLLFFYVKRLGSYPTWGIDAKPGLTKMISTNRLHFITSSWDGFIVTKV